MNLLAIVASPRKGKATDTLVDKVIEGVLSAEPACSAKKIHLSERDIKFCNNCLACRNSKTPGPVAKCVMRDDMDAINEDLLASDALVFGTPLHMGYASAIMMAFLERIAWTFARPGRRILTLTCCPLPRSEKKRKAAIVIVSGNVPPIYRMLCDKATPLIRDTARESFNAETVGTIYAGNIEGRGVEYYFDRAHSLGRKLVSE